MPDHFTACLATDEATLKAILTAAPYNHTYIETFGPFTKGDLRFNVYDFGRGADNRWRRNGCRQQSHRSHAILGANASEPRASNGLLLVRRLAIPRRRGRRGA